MRSGLETQSNRRAYIFGTCIEYNPPNLTNTLPAMKCINLLPEEINAEILPQAVLKQINHERNLVYLKEQTKPVLIELKAQAN
jgi:hypothetical protein